MRARVIWLFIATLTVAVCEECSGPSAPTKVTAPPVVSAPPAITCPNPISITAPLTGQTFVKYDGLQANGGENPVTLSCSPEADTAFPVGTTNVECTATDAMKRTASCSFAVTVTASPRLSRNRILAFGDSITEGEVVVPGTDNVILTVTPQPYPALLAQFLRERYGDQPAVFNAGLGGEKAALADRRLPFEMGKYSADVVVLLEGANDIYNDPVNGIHAVELGVGALAAEARNRRVRAFICTLTPTKPGRRGIPLGIIQAANDRLRAVARGENAPVIDLFSALLPDVDGNIDSDGLHPTALGYRRIAETVFAALRADLEIH
jgi:lysophospholipase L1-like esterase